jgi:pimeloyl-ACP methyl ester carboxylesterase
MVFPSTSEKVLSSKELDDYRNSNEGKDPDYLARPTIICCNPNALFYHHMVNAPNNYWLSFYLKKGINVVAWNYRGYGNTKGSCTPYNVKSDGESVLYFVTNELGIKGKIGVYGRSLGGICATHLAVTYPDKIELLIADRTFGNFRDISLRKFPGSGTSYLFDLITLKWEA